jgi:hypothetical protein
MRRPDYIGYYIALLWAVIAVRLHHSRTFLPDAHRQCESPEELLPDVAPADGDQSKIVENALRARLPARLTSTFSSSRSSLSSPSTAEQQTL